MFKLHPIVNLIDIIIFLLVLIFAQNNIFIFSLVLLLLFCAYKHERLLLFLCFTLAILVINILCGKLIVLGRFLTFISYLCTMFVDYSKIDFIRVYDTLFPSDNCRMTKVFLKCLYFKDYFRNNFNIMIDSTKKIGYKNDFKYYLFCIRNTFNLTIKSLDQLINTYEKRFYFNDYRNKYKVVISFLDIFMFVVHLICLIIVLKIGV